MTAAGASAQGTVWFTDRWALEDEADRERLAQIVSASPTTPPAELRALALGRLMFAWAAGSAADLSVPLRDAGFLEYNPPPGRDVALEQVPLASSEVIVVSGSNAAVPNTDLGLPVVNALLEAGVESLVVEPTTSPVDDGEEAPPPGLAKLVREEDTVSGRVSSVDAIEDYRGRMAAVLALAELRQGRTGHYGVADGAERLLPEAPQ